MSLVTSDAPAPLLVHLGRPERLGHREPAADQAGFGEGAGMAVHEPDEAEAGHRNTDTSERCGKEEGCGARGAQQATVVRRGHGESLSLPGGTAHRGRRCPNEPTRGRRLEPSSGGAEKGHEPRTDSITEQKSW
ncbi:hypothetical protein GCM10023335_50650 [Streptomyces siamensis]|uniref:Uncharacterized protein n=1 Tax=Streptomyces siamensis TaxID=1274986 RepID=A0ABP9J6M3_9ACTN